MNLSDFLLQTLSAFVGTVAFALLFGVPKKHFLTCGLVAALGWALYLVFSFLGASASIATFFGTVLAALLSRCFAVRECCPKPVFLTTGIFPLIPGGGIYWTAYYLVINDTAAAMEKGFTAAKCVVAIVLGIVLVNELPGKLFRVFKKRNE